MTLPVKELAGELFNEGAYLNDVPFFKGERIGVIDVTMIFDGLCLNTETFNDQ